MSEGNGLPKGWAEATVDEVAPPTGGLTKNPKRQSLKRQVPYLRVANVYSNELRLEEMEAIGVGDDELAKLLLRAGDLLVVEGNGSKDQIGRVALWDASIAPCVHQNHIIKARPAFEMGKWLLYFLISRKGRSRIEEVASSTSGLYTLSISKVASLVVPIAPLPEQHRIVEKIEELFSDLDAGVASLERAKANLKRYRASVLKSAVEGRLTEEWRKEHSEAEDGQMLLDRILRERREKWEKEQLLRFKEKGKEPPKNWESKYEEPSAPDASELPELPEGWVWASLDMVLREPLRNGHSARTSEDGRGVRTISITAVTYDAFTEDNIKYTIADPTFVEDLWLEPGDILIQRSNTPELVGTARLFTGESHFAIFPDLLIRIRTTPAVSERFIALLLQASATRHYFRSHAKGMSGSMPKIDQGTVLACPVPLPPLTEQEQIVSLVEERLSQIEPAEKTINAELIRCKRLRQSILKRAFEGKLVPQDSKDEPASVLLEWIKASREAEQPKNKAKKAMKVKAR